MRVPGAVSETSQRQLGDSDSPIEDELEDAFTRMVDEGSQRLHRSWREVLVTGFFGGTEVAMGVLAYLSVLHATGDPLLAGLAFAIGFLALLLGRSELFLFTKPDNAALFSSAGFWPIARAGDQAVLMENSRERLSRYCRQLTMYRQPGEKIGAIVMNANPFTLGHRYLVQQACQECDWVHLFVVQENASEFPYEDRLALLEAGVADLKNLSIHPGSDYMISRATFPSYFLKSQKIINHCHMALDLQLFRKEIAPALGINRRYVGTEPMCAVTAQYNKEMAYWLTTRAVDAPEIELHEIERQQLAAQPISACRVRDLLAKKGPEAVKALVPESTYRYLWQHFSLSKTSSPKIQTPQLQPLAG